MNLLFLLIIPAIIAVSACKTNRYLFKALQTAVCLLIVFILGIYFSSYMFLPLAFAFAASIMGDYFLSFNEKSKNFFIYGVALYFLAHVGYLLYIVISFGIATNLFVIAFILLTAGYLVYFFVALNKNIKGAIKYAVLFYLIISCAVFALAISALVWWVIKIIVVAGIALIVISDTIISEKDFLQHKRFEYLILPTYYAAQILLTASFIMLTVL